MIDRDENNHENLQVYFSENLLGGHVMIVDDFPSEVDSMLKQDADISFWHTKFRENSSARTHPQGGKDYDNILIRLPRSHEYFDYVLQVISPLLAPTGKVYVYGLNDEGIKGAAKKLHQFYGNAESVAIKNHGRIIACYLDKDSSSFPSRELQDFASIHTLSHDKQNYRMTYYPGMFAHGELDAGTSLLLDNALSSLKDKSRVLDFACGSGIVGTFLQNHLSNIQLDLLDNDSISLAAASVNIGSCNEIILGDSLRSCADRMRYDLIISNPPIHTQKNLQLETLYELINQAPHYLTPRGKLLIVVQTRLKIEEQFEKVFHSYIVKAETTRFKVIEGSL